MGKLFNESFIDPLGNKIVGFADTNLMDEFYDTDLYAIFCSDILEYDHKTIFVSDESCLTDFPEEREVYIERVKNIFKIDISDMKYLYLPIILQRIIDSRETKY